MRSVAVGEVTQPVRTWNPRGSRGVLTYIDLSAVDQDAKDITEARPIRCDEAPSRARQLVEEGDVLVSTVRPNLNGVARVPASLRGATASTGFTVLRPRPALDGAYLFHWVRSPGFVAEMVKNATGASYPAVSDAIVRSSAIPLPSLAVQRRIAAILDQVDALRSLGRRSLSHADQLVPAIFVAMFGHPASRADLSGPMTRLGDLARIVRGASPRPAGDPRYFGGPIPWLKISDVTRETARVVREVREGVTEAGRDRSVLIPSGTLILTNSATVGLPKVVGVSTCIHDGFLAFLDLVPEVDQAYFYAALLLSRHALVGLAPHGTQKNLNTMIVKGFEVPLPPIAEQKVFAARLHAVESAAAAQARQQTELEGLFAALQGRAFKGEL